MNWLKSKMGSHGWDINDGDIKKPDVLFLSAIRFAKQELEDFEEYFTVKASLPGLSLSLSLSPDNST